MTHLSRGVTPENSEELVGVACQPWSVTLHEQAGSAPAWVLPVRVDGPSSFVLVGVWSVASPGRDVLTA